MRGAMWASDLGLGLPDTAPSSPLRRAPILVEADGALKETA